MKCPGNNARLTQTPVGAARNLVRAEAVLISREEQSVHKAEDDVILYHSASTNDLVTAEAFVTEIWSAQVGIGGWLAGPAMPIES